MISINEREKWRWMLGPLLILISCSISTSAFAQNPTDTFPRDPGSISVYTVQNMSFGAFAQGISGGTVVISNNGSRSVTGSVIPLNLGVQYYQANFEIEGPVGSVISILNGPDATLLGSNGGSMSLHISNSDPMSPFSIAIGPPGRTLVSFGGTLTVGGPLTTLAGTYTGTFLITFNQE